MAEGPRFPDPVPLIYNPASGGGRGNIRFRETQALFAAEDIRVEGHATKAPDHATELAKDLADAGHPFIFVLGGDGTLSESSNGILQSSKKPTLGFLPAGTGNDFLRDFEVLERAQAIDRIRLGQVRKIDALDVRWDGGQRWCINVFGTGFAAQAADITNKKYKWAGGQAYNLGVIHRLMGLKPTKTKLTMDGETREGDYPMVMVCNSIHTGGAMKRAPMARPDDGVADVLWIEQVNRRQLLGLLAGVREGRHVRHDHVHFQRAKDITIEPQDASPLLVDGEVIGSTPVSLKMKKGALQVLL